MMRSLKFLLTLIAVPVAMMSTAVQAQLISTPADFALIMDYDTGAILFEKDADTPTAPASMSKLMTAAIVFEKLKSGDLALDDKFAVSEKAWRMGGSKMWVRVDTEIELKNLLRGVIVQSGNDACIVIAENISGSEDAFAELMNRKAREWGMNNSSFANATGWPHPDHKMSMRDLALLTQKIIKEYPEYYAIFNEREFSWEKINQPNRNPLLSAYEGADGLKTGHTEESGYGLVGSAVNKGSRRIVVINGLTSSKDRSNESRRLMRAAFNDFERKTIYGSGDVVGYAEVFAGKEKVVPLVTAAPISVILHRNAIASFSATVIYDGPIKAPIAKNQQIGYLKIEWEGNEPREYPLFAAKGVWPVGVFGRIGLAAKKLLIKPEESSLEDSDSDTLQ